MILHASVEPATRHVKPWKPVNIWSPAEFADDESIP